MTEQSELSHLQIDLIREVASIGSGHAATVLSKMTDRRIMIDVPEVNLYEVSEIANRFRKDEPLVVLSMRMLGDLTGLTTFVIPEQGAAMLTDLLLRREIRSDTQLGELEESGLKEIGNIMASSFMNALARCFGKLLIPSVPELLRDRAEDVVSLLALQNVSDKLLLVETDFSFLDNPLIPAKVARDRKLGGVLLFAPDAASIESIFAETLAA